MTHVHVLWPVTGCALTCTFSYKRLIIPIGKVMNVVVFHRLSLNNITLWQVQR